MHLFIVVVQVPRCVWLFVTPWSAACRATTPPIPHHFLKFTKFKSIASVMLSSHLILWYPLLFLPSVIPSIRDFSSESAVCIRWPKYWSFSVSIYLHICFSSIIGTVLNVSVHRVFAYVLDYLLRRNSWNDVYESKHCWEKLERNK